MSDKDRTALLLTPLLATFLTGFSTGFYHVLRTSLLGT